MKVSDTPFDAVEPYLEEEAMDVFIGSEPLVRAGMERGAVGAVSGLATAWPSVVSALVHDHSPEAHLRVTELRTRLESVPGRPEAGAPGRGRASPGRRSGAAPGPHAEERTAV